MGQPFILPSTYLLVDLEKIFAPLSDKMRSRLRNKLSDLKVIITDEISIVSNDLLFHVHLWLTEIFGSVNDQPFASVSVIAVAVIFFGFHR